MRDIQKRLGNLTNMVSKIKYFTRFVKTRCWCLYLIKKKFNLNLITHQFVKSLVDSSYVREKNKENKHALLN